MASIINSRDKVKRFRYKCTSLELLVKGMKPTKLDTRRLKDMSIIYDYEEYIYPLFKVTLVMTDDLYYYILKNKNNCKIRLRLQSFYQVGSSSKKSLYRDYINTTFNIIEDADDEDMNNALKEDISKKNFKKIIKDDTNEMTGKKENRVSFFLFKNIDGGRKLVGNVLKNATITDAIVYLCTVGKRDNVIMAAPDNKTKYRQLLIPHTTVIKALHFIDTYYGIYKVGSMIFFDFTKTYIIPYSGDCKAWFKNEIKNINIIIPKSINTKVNNQNGILKKTNDKANYYIVANGKTMGIKNSSISHNYIKGNDIKVVDGYDGKVKKGTSKSKTKNKSHATVVINKTENKYLDTMYTAQTQAKSIVITLRLENIDASIFTPNKKYNVIFEDKKYTKKYNGKYIIAGIDHEFSDDGSSFSIMSTIKLRKDLNK